MRFFLIVLSLFLLLSCSSSHKLTGVDYVDLSTGSMAAVDPIFPTEIAMDLGWGDLSTDSLTNVGEEFRVSLISDFEPHQLFRVHTDKRKIKGESILFWGKTNSNERTNAHEDMKQYLNGKCNQFYETATYNYCRPTFITEPNWGEVFKDLEERNIWQMPDQSQLEIEAFPDTNIWTMNTQVRLGDYFRSYTQTNPDKYSRAIDERTDILGILAVLQLTKTDQYKAENDNIYSGITSGEKGSSFMLCDESEDWRFDASLAELIFESGYPAKIDETEDQYFFITVSGTVEDEWYANRGNSTFLRVIQPYQIYNLSTVSKKECPAN